MRGQVVSEFGTLAGKSSKGIEIAVPQGTPVLAAAAGKVIYSGNGIRGYGNLVILEHGDSYFTVYGFNHRNLVAVNSFVGQGQQIASERHPVRRQKSSTSLRNTTGEDGRQPDFFLAMTGGLP